MSNQPSKTAPETISKYEVLFALRTGVTVLLPKVAAFDCGPEMPIHFRISPDNSQDILISANEKAVILKGMKKNLLDAAVSRGFIMFYEMKDEEVIRCTHCSYQKI